MEIGRCYRMEMNVEKPKVMGISGLPSPIQIMIDQKQPENVEYFNYLSSVINYASCTRDIQSRTAVAKAAFNKKKTFHQQIVLKFKEETSKMVHLGHSFVWC